MTNDKSYGSINDHPRIQSQNTSPASRICISVFVLSGIAIICYITVLFCSKESPVSAHATRKIKQPNILFIMADDLGWGDVSWHDPEMQTPVLEQLAKNSVYLNQSYVNQVCSQTRSAFFTGYDPYHIGTQSGGFHAGQPEGVPLNYTFFTKHLQKLNYTTYMVGKLLRSYCFRWHLGYCKEDYLPTSRGFDYYKGFLQGGGDYFTPEHSEEVTLASGATQILTGYDFWKQDKVDYVDKGKYSTDVFESTALSYLQRHKRQNGHNPFYLFLSFQATHRPLQVPNRFLKYCHQKNEARRTYCAMAKAMDESIGNVIEELKTLDLYDDTLIIFQSDNGGDVGHGASNYPLRGNKGTLWEGGCRTVAFVHSPKLLPQVTGLRNQLFFVTDWYPTLLSLAGMEMDSYGDGFNQWSMILGKTKVGTRNYLVYNIDTHFNSTGIRVGRYKLVSAEAGGLVGVGMDGWYKAADTQSYRPFTEVLGKTRLFDLIVDPSEVNDLYNEMPDIVKSMSDILNQFVSGEVPYIPPSYSEASNPSLYNDTWFYGFC